MRCGRTPPKETKVCPVCDATIPADARNCPECLTDLSLFDVAGESAEGVDVQSPEGKNIDDILTSIMEGRADQPEIFESLKSVGTSRASEDEVIETERPKVPEPETPEVAPETAPEPEQQFLCPVCDTVVHPDDKVCPGCGAEFSEGEATEYECPVCKAAVPADADHCPSCGVHFESEGETAGPPEPEPEPAPALSRISESPTSRPTATAGVASAMTPPGAGTTTRGTLHSRLDSLREDRRSASVELPQGDVKLMARELPKLVNDVKPLLISAKRIGLEIETGKRLINDAVQAGKRRDIEKAVRLIAEARQSLDLAFVTYIGGRLEAFATEVDRAQGRNPTSVDAVLEESFSQLRSGHYDAAWDALQTATQGFQSQAKEFSETRVLLDGDAALSAELRNLGMDVREVDRLAKQSRDSLDRRDPQTALRLARQAHERLTAAVPGFVEGQMKKGRDTLLDLKVRGGDVSKYAGILKEASAHVKSGDWGDALRYLREFYREVGRSSRT